VGPPFRHDAAFYASDDEYLAVVVPFLRDGLAAGVPTLLRTGEERARRVVEALGEPAGLTVAAPPGHPITALQADRDTYAGHLDAGAARVQVVVDVPVAPAGWPGWARYESVGNHLHRDRPVWTLCPYDTRSTPPAVLDDVARTHPHLRTADGSRSPNPDYADPAEFLAERARSESDPLEDGPPDVDLVDPAPARGRRALAALGAPETLVYAVSEVLTNAVQHGRPPVRMRAWCAPGRIVVTVHDRGPGPRDPFAGLLPAGRRPLQAGLGLWMAHRMCDRITIHRGGPEGCTVRLVSYA
jgi:anti-sigma regulatory factor (Ser/Thr protein kinase)